MYQGCYEHVETVRWLESVDPAMAELVKATGERIADLLAIGQLPDEVPISSELRPLYRLTPQQLRHYRRAKRRRYLKVPRGAGNEPLRRLWSLYTGLVGLPTITVEPLGSQHWALIVPPGGGRHRVTGEFPSHAVESVAWNEYRDAMRRDMETRRQGQ